MFDEQIDLITGAGLAGRLRSQQRSVPDLMASHGRMSVGNTPGLEVVSYDRSAMALADLVEPTLRVEVNAQVAVAKPAPTEPADVETDFEHWAAVLTTE